MEDEELQDGKVRWKAVLAVVLVLSIAVPGSFIALFMVDEGNSTYYCTFREFHEKYDALELKAGDVVYIEDTLSGIWYNQTAQYTHMTFESMDEIRTVPWGYDTGYRENITDEFSEGESVRLIIELTQEIGAQGVPVLVGHILEIEHLG